MSAKADLTSVYHITWGEQYGVCSLYFWGCNLRCRICLLKREVLDCHLPETRLRIYDPSFVSRKPRKFLTFEQIVDILECLPIKRVFLMGAEPLCDPLLPRILEFLRGKKYCLISLLTNGKLMPPLDMVDEIIFSIKAISHSLHKDYTGFSNRGILSNFRKLAGVPRIRLNAETVFIPNYVDEAEVIRIAAFIASIDPAVPLRIDAYLPVPGQPWRVPEIEEIEKLRDRVCKILPGATSFHGKQGNEPLVYEVKRVF
jgi:pyruvate-formate lyase-activating enzyme